MIQQVMPSKFKLPILIVNMDLEGHQSKSLWPSPHINTSAVLHLFEDSVIIVEEVRTYIWNKLVQFCVELLDVVSSIYFKV